jgi:hypothetical protein
LIHSTPLNGTAARGVAAVDPILAAIKRHRAANTAYLNAAEPARDAQWDALQHAEYDMLKRTTPATVAGAIALLDYLAQFRSHNLWHDNDEANHLTRELICDIRDALKGMAGG